MKTSTVQKPLPRSTNPEAGGFALNRSEILRIAVLILLAVACWCYITGRTTVAAWQVPLEYGLNGADGDAQAVFSHIKAASEGEFYPGLVKNVSRLGAPYYANWSDFPIIEEWQFFLPGVLAKFIGLFAAANAAVMLAQVLACVSFYIVARLLGGKWWWSFAGGLAFGFAQFALARSIHHLMVTNYWYIPFCLLIATWITRDEMGEYRGRKYIFAVIASFVMGMQNPYYTNMFLQLTLLGALYQYFRQGWKPVIQAGGIVAASAFGFLMMNVDTIVYRLGHGANPGAVVRQYIWLELSALKFVDMLMPPPDHPLFGALGQAYYGVAGKQGLVAFPCEVPPSCYLGLIGIACFVWLVVVSLRRLLTQTGRNLPVEAWQVMWILFYAMVGGLNCLAGIVGATLFRSSTRYCIFILPIILLFAVKRLSKKRLDMEIGVALAGLCALVALWDQTPPVMTEAKMAQDAQVVESDRAFTQQMEARLPKGAMVFQVPIMDFPESPAAGVGSSDHMRPYLHSQNLRFSFGALKGRPWLQWQKDLSKLSLPDIVHAVETYGFSAIYVNRNGLQDKGEGLVKEFRRLGYSEVIESKAGDLLCIIIHPDPHPLLPAGTVN